MPASQAQDSVGEAAVCVDGMSDDNAMWVSPVTNLTQRMSSASFHSNATPVRGAAAFAGGKTPLLSDTVRFNFDDSNDSMLQFAATSIAAAAATVAPMSGSSSHRRHTIGGEEDEADDDWVLPRANPAADDDDDDDEDTRSGGTPCRPGALTFCSSPSEPTIRRLWSPTTGGLTSAMPPPRLASVPFDFSSSPTSAGAIRQRVRAGRSEGPARALPPPPLPPPARRSFKRPSPTLMASDAAPESPAVASILDVPQAPSSSRRQPATPKRRRLEKTPLGNVTNSGQAQQQHPQQPFKKPVLHRCTSELSALTSKFNPILDTNKIDNAIASIDTLNLIGNSEQQHSLPTVKELSYGIRYVNGATVSQLVRGHYDDRVPNYEIIDCRYPYEFDGGHIQGAVNIYKQEDLLTRVMEPVVAGAADLAAASARAPVLIFHCEFSSERAPKLASYLRENDRVRNAENYPNLYFPEVYVLQGGYKSFFEAHREDCQPLNYVRMADPGFKAELVTFQRDRRTWERQNSRTKHSQLQRLASCQQFH